LAHTYGKKVNIAMNGIIHPEKMKKVPEYLQFLKEIEVDQLTVGDTGIIYTMKKHPEWRIPYIFDAETLVTSARQINFWAKRGAVGAVLAREVPFEEMKAMEEKLNVPVEILVYGATCIHQSKRPLLQNYYHFTKQEERVDRDRGLFRTWKLDGLFTPGENFVKITKAFVEAKEQILAGTWNEESAEILSKKISELHPQNRELDTGFFYIDPEAIK